MEDLYLAAAQGIAWLGKGNAGVYAIVSRRAKKIAVKCVQYALHDWGQVGSPQGQSNERLPVLLGEARVLA